MNKFSIAKVLILNFALFFLIGCGSTSKKNLDIDYASENNNKVFIWESKANIRDLKKNKNNQVAIDFISIKNKRLRLEIQASIGIQVGSLVMNQDQFIALIYPQKKLIKGKLNEKTLMKSFNLPIPPQALYSIAFEDQVRFPQWKCSFEGSLISICENASTQTKIEWKNRNSGTKLVKITNPNIEVDWFFKVPKVQEFREEIFALEIPPDYKTTEIN